MGYKATPGQCEFIDDLLERHGLSAAEMAEEAGEPSWADYEALGRDEASEVIDWLKDYGR